MSDHFHALHIQLGSVEELTHAFEGTAWSTEFYQLERGSGGASLTAVATDRWMLAQTDMQRATHQTGDLNPDVIAFGLPTCDQAPVRFGSREVNSDCLTRFDPRTGLDAVSAGGFSAYTLVYDRLNLQRRLDCLGLDGDLVVDGPREHKVIQPHTLARLRLGMNRILTMGSGAATTAAQAQAMDSDLAVELLRAFYSGEDIAAARRSNRSRVVSCALDYIRANLNQVLTVEDLCRESAASISTLERAFREHFGVSPKQYLISVRLGGVRRALLNPANNEGIGDVAANWGFWHMSKFAADYKRLYGELPSATRKLAA